MATMRTTNVPAGQRYAPLNRESFLDAQQRNRHATWRLSAVCAIAVLLMGIPLSLIVTPLLYALALLSADIINYFAPLPAAFWRLAGEVAHFGSTALLWLLPPHKQADAQTLILGAVVMIVPGVLLSVFLWAAIFALFRRSGVGGALLALQAREPNRTDLKELQLADIAEEMAIASGLPPPRVMLVDAPGANAAAIGTSPSDARIVVSRRVLDDLSRDQLEGVLAHLIASVGNGDLHIAFRMTSVFETCGLLVTLINSPFGSQSRSVLWRVLRYSLWRSSGDGGAQEAAAVGDLLSRNVGADTNDIDRFFNPARTSRLRSIVSFIFFPILFTNLAIKMSLWFFSSVLLGPAMALLWHTRQYLADASAVQLTRNPDGLTGALEKLKDEPTEIPGSDWAAHLFFVNPKASGRLPAPDARQRQLLAQAWSSSDPRKADVPSTPPAFPLMQSLFAATMRAAASGDAQAIERLRSLYRDVAAADPSLAAQFPNPDDMFSARRGDIAALSKLRVASRQSQSQLSVAKKDSSMSSVSLVGFHSSLQRRLKRLARMGAHPELELANRRGTMVAFAIYALFAPFGLAIAAGFLLIISIMMLTSVTFLAVWMAFIHKVFALLGHA